MHSAWVQNRGSPRGGCLGFTRRCVRGIFRHVHAATKNDLASFRRRRRRKEGRGFGPSWTLPGTVGRGTKVPGRLPASSGSACYPPGREAASAGGGAAAAAGRGRGGSRRSARKKTGILRSQSLALLTKLSAHGMLFDNYCPRKRAVGPGGRWLKSIFGV